MIMDKYVPWIVRGWHEECFARFSEAKHKDLVGGSSACGEDKLSRVESYFVSSYLFHELRQSLQLTYIQLSCRHLRASLTFVYICAHIQEMEGAYIYIHS